MTDEEQAIEMPKVAEPEEVGQPTNGEVPEEEPNKPEPGAQIIAEVTVQFDSTGSMGARYANMKPNLLWAAGKFLETLGTRVWNEQRDAEVMAQMQEQAEIEKVMAAMKGGLVVPGARGRRS